jgi:hypothetical protein
MKIEIEPGSMEHWYLLSMIGYYIPHIMAATLLANERP